MGQSQRTSRSPVITCCFQTGTEKTEVECGWQEGHQRSHEKTLGGETSRSSVALADCGKKTAAKAPTRTAKNTAGKKTAEKGTEGYGSSRNTRGSIDQCCTARTHCSIGTLDGAQVGDLFMSLIHTAELCGANSFDYLAELQRHARELAANPAAWMPWNYRERLQTAGVCCTFLAEKDRRRLWLGVILKWPETDFPKRRKSVHVCGHAPRTAKCCGRVLYPLFDE